MNMSQNSSDLQATSQNSSVKERRAGAREIFDKSWTLCFGNSEIKLEADREIELRWAKIDDINIRCKVERNKFDSSMIINRHLRLSCGDQIVEFQEKEIKLNLVFIYIERSLSYRVLNIFEKNKQHLKKIKHLQKRLIFEINKFHNNLFEKKEIISPVTKAYIEDYLE